jgi:hypothetical protein
MDYPGVTANMTAAQIKSILNAIDSDSDSDSDGSIESGQDWTDSESESESESESDSDSDSDSESEDDEPVKIACRHCGRKLLAKNLVAHQQTKTCKAKQNK